MIQQFKGTLTKDEYYAKIKEQKINNINCGKKLKKIENIVQFLIKIWGKYQGFYTLTLKSLEFIMMKRVMNLHK